MKLQFSVYLLHQITFCSPEDGHISERKHSAIWMTQREGNNGKTYVKSHKNIIFIWKNKEEKDHFQDISEIRPQKISTQS